MRSLCQCILGLIVLFLLEQQGLAADPVSLEPAEPITRVEELRQLSPEAASEGRPVRITGQILFMDAPLGLGFLTDGSAGAYFLPPTEPTDAVLPAGALVRITGISAMGLHGPRILGVDGGGVELQQAGWTDLPEPTPISSEDLYNPSLLDQWVELAGVVRDMKETGGRTWIQLGTGDRLLTTLVLGERSGLFRDESWIGALLRLRGVLASHHEGGKETMDTALYVPSLSRVTVEESGIGTFDERPIQKISDMPVLAIGLGPRIRVAGNVTLSAGGSGLFIRDDTGVLWIESMDPETRPAGMAVDAVGFPGFERGRPVLRNAFVRSLGQDHAPLPRRITSMEAASGAFHGDLVQLQARILDSLSEPLQQTVLLLREEGMVFEARLMESSSTLDYQPPERGALVEITGICLNPSGPLTSSSAEPGHPLQGELCTLLLRSPGDIRLLRPPPFWSQARLRLAFWGLVSLAVLFLGWNATLRHQVGLQTLFIRSQAEKETLQEERMRMARELHDTLEQELTGISIQLDAARDILDAHPDRARTALEGARALLKHTRTEARRSVWDLRQRPHGPGDLVPALQEALGQSPEGTLPQRQFETTGAPWPLPGQVEGHLIRIISEAVTNSLKHAEARHLTLRAAFHTDRLDLEIQDDGHGFETQDALRLKSGHYGLLGMRERVTRIGATLDIQSSPGQGTRIRLSVPRTEIHGPQAI